MPLTTILLFIPNRAMIAPDPFTPMTPNSAEQPAARVTSSADRQKASAPAPVEPSTILADRKIEIRGKIFFLDVIENKFGVALRISEQTASRRNRVVIPQEHFEVFAGCVMDMMAAAKGANTSTPV